MVLGSRKRAIAAAASAIAAMALAAAMAGKSCRVADSSPQGVARAFTAAARAGDHKAVYEMLGPKTRARLLEAAKRSTDLVGGSRRFKPLDLVLAVGVSEPDETPAPKQFLLKSKDGDHAVVEIITADDTRHDLTLVKVDGTRKIEVPEYRRPAP